jgi:hypothetical protein
MHSDFLLSEIYLAFQFCVSQQMSELGKNIRELKSILYGNICGSEPVAEADHTDRDRCCKFMIKPSLSSLSVFFLSFFFVYVYVKMCNSSMLLSRAFFPTVFFCSNGGC